MINLFAAVIFTTMLIKVRLIKPSTTEARMLAQAWLYQANAGTSIVHALDHHICIISIMVMQWT